MLVLFLDKYVMADKPCVEADIVTTALLAWDDDLAQELVKLKNQKTTYAENRAKLKVVEEKQWLNYWEQKNALRLKEESADMQIRQIINAKILSWDAQAQAYEKLAKSMLDSWRSAWATITLLDKLRTANIKDINDIVKKVMKPWEKVTDVIKRIKDNISKVGSSLYEQQKVIEKISVDEMIKQGKSNKEIKEALKKQAEEDKKLVQKWLNPTNFSKPDPQWTVIKNTISDPEEQLKAWWQYILWKAIIGDVDQVTLKYINDIYHVKNTVGKLNASQIYEIETLEELMARAYTNASDLATDWLLRDAYKKRFLELSSWIGITKDEIEYAKRLINAERFANEWVAFSQIVTHEEVASLGRKMGLDAEDANKFYKTVIDTVKDEKNLDNLTSAWKITMTDGQLIEPSQLLELIVAATGDTNIPKLIREGIYDSWTLLWIGTQVLLWNKGEATKKIIKLITKAKEAYNMWDSVWLALEAITWRKIQPWSKVGFFDYRSIYKESNMLPETRIKAEFQEKMANANRCTLNLEWVEDLTKIKSLAEKLKNEYKWWYIIVNDSWYLNNQEFRKALYEANKGLKDEEKITVLYPKQAQMSNFTLEGGDLIFRSRDVNTFNQIMDKVSLKTLWDSSPTKDILSIMEILVKGTDEERLKAVQKYNEELEELANKYYASMLWKQDWNNKNMRDTLHAQLEQMTWIAIKDFRDLIKFDKNKLWQVVDAEFTNAQKLTWKFTSKIEEDIWIRMAQIENYSLDELKKVVSQTLNWLIDESVFTESKAPLLKQALQDFETAWTIEEWLEAKGRLLSMANGWQAQTFTTSNLVDMFTNWTNIQVYKDIFFPNQEISDELMKKYVNQINDMIFDSFTVSVAQNLTKMGYSLPLVNVRDAVFDYLTNSVTASWDFAKAFLYKNWLPESNSLMKQIMDLAMPTNIKLWYEEAMYTLRKEWAKSWQITRIVTEDNPFLADTYSSIISLAAARAWKTVNVQESKYLSSLLDKYEEIIKDEIKEWISFERAQQLKTQLWYALDIFEQDILLPKYWSFLTQPQKSALRNMKSYVAIVVWKEWDAWVSGLLEEMKNANLALKSQFNDTIGETLSTYETVRTALAWGEKWKKQLTKIEEQLKQEGSVMKNVNWEILIVDVKDNLRRNMKDIPSTVSWLEWIESLLDDVVEWLDNRTAYYLNSLIETTKKLDWLAKWETTLISTMNPQLKMFRFFDMFSLIDEWADRIPKALRWNILNGSNNLLKYNTNWLNQTLKTNIFSKIKTQFWREWFIDMKGLNDIIESVLTENNTNISKTFVWASQKELKNIRQEIFNQYQKAFTPYTHLKDIPTGWGVDWVVNVRERINAMLNEEIDRIRGAVEWLPEDAKVMLSNVYVTSPTWQTLSIQDVLDWKNFSWKQAIFDDENILVKTADEYDMKIAKTTKDKDIKATDKINKAIKMKVANEYNSVLQALENQQTLVTEADRALTNSFMVRTGRTIAKRYTLTNRLIDADNALAWINEDCANMMKHWVIGTWNTFTWGKNKANEIMDRFKQVQEAYKKYYTFNLDWVNSIIPTNEAEEMAQKLARYFKTLEWYLGSVDWSVWTTAVNSINRAFYNLWEVVMNIDTLKWVHALMSWIGQNQFFKFFKFSKEWQASYVKQFTKLWWASSEDLFWWYREYISKIPDNINVDEFNRIFASNFTDKEFKILWQWLAWVTLSWWMWKNINRILNFVNGSNTLFRMMLSYPWQLFTIPQQGTAYFIKQKGFEKQIMEDMGTVDRIRSSYWTLKDAYNEINVLREVSPDNPNLYYNRYGTPDIEDAYAKAGIYSTDDVNDMYWKLMKYQSTWDNTWKVVRSIDAYKDNANNLVDWLFARNFKNIAFAKALRENSFIQFCSAEAFEQFMKNPQVSQQIKNQLMDAVNASAGRNFKNILGLWFGWLDRLVWGGSFSNIMYWLMQFFNFRWQWWQNIIRQTGEVIYAAFRMMPMWLSKEWRDNIAKWVANNPEFKNLVTALWNDLEYSFKLTRYQDNGRRNELETESDWTDYLWYMTEMLQMTSQWYQGIQSYWPARLILQPLETLSWPSLNPNLSKWWAAWWAFFTALGNNAWRNRKPANMLFQLIQAFEEWGSAWARAYLYNERWKLSFGSMRYMMNDDSNGYSYTLQVLWDQWGIPSILMWESALGWDKTYSYQLSNWNTGNTLKQIFTNDDITWDDKSTLIGNLTSWVINGSQFAWAVKNFLKTLPEEGRKLFGVWDRKSPFITEDFMDVIEKTKAWDELIRTWKVTPTTAREMKLFIWQYLDEWDSSNRSSYKPYGENFAKAISNYNQMWYINWLEGHSWDIETEYMLSQIRYKRDENGKFIEKDGQKIETDFWKNMVQQIKIFWTDKREISNAISKQVFEWIESNNDDPNYLLYQSLVGQGLADYYLDEAWDDYMNTLNLTIWGKKASEKRSKTEAQEHWIYWDNFMAYLLKAKVSWTDTNLVTYLQELDRESAIQAWLNIIRDQVKDDGDKITLSHFLDTYKDSYWNERIKIKSQYISWLKSVWWLWDAIDKWDIDLLIARSSQYANTYIKEDPTGIITLWTIESLAHRISDADISPRLKIRMLWALGENNLEFIQTHLPELRETLWTEFADAFVDTTNNLVYSIDWVINDAITDAIMANDVEAVKSWSSLSSKAKAVLSSTSSTGKGSWYGSSYNWYWGRKSTTNWVKWIPYTLDIAKLLSKTWGKWYSPKNAEVNIKTFKPTVDLSINKDVSRWKKHLTTQKVSKSKVVL